MRVRARASTPSAAPPWPNGVSLFGKQPCGRDVLAKDSRIELPFADPNHVARANPRNRRLATIRGGQLAAQRGDRIADLCRRGTWRLLAPQYFQDPIDADHLVSLQEQTGQAPALSWPTDVHAIVAEPDFDRSENFVPHLGCAAAVGAVIGTRYASMPGARRLGPERDTDARLVVPFVSRTDRPPRLRSARWTAIANRSLASTTESRADCPAVPPPPGYAAKLRASRGSMRHDETLAADRRATFALGVGDRPPESRQRDGLVVFHLGQAQLDPLTDERREGPPRPRRGHGSAGRG